MSITVAREPRELTITSEGVRWAGPTDPEPDAPIVECNLAVPLDARAIADFVARGPVPSVLLHELATRCPPGDDANADPRWRRARATAAIARGHAAAAVRDETGTPIEKGVEAVRVLRDGTLVRIRDGALVIGDMPPIALPVHERQMYQLLTPLWPDAIDPDEVVVAVYRGDSTTLLAYKADGRERARLEAPLPFFPYQVARSRAGYWLSNDSHIQLFGGDAGVRRPRVVRQCLPIAARWLLDLERPTGAWVSLDSGERREFAWEGEAMALVGSDDVLWCTTQEGLWRLRGGESPVRVWSGDVRGVAVDAMRACLGSARGGVVLAIDLATGAELWRAPLEHAAYQIHAFDSVIVAVATNRCTLLSPADGRILATTAERRDVGVARLADGTVGVSCGEQVLLVDPAGTVTRALPMPYDGQIIHATLDRFVFGKVQGGDDHVAPTANIAFDRTGRVTGRLVPTARPAFVDDKHVYMLDYAQGRELRVWDPRGTTSGIEPPPPRRPTERGQRHIGSEVTNPRDDRPEVGIEVHADFLALDGTYHGSGGYMGEVSLRVGDGAIAAFARCDLSSSSDGAIAERQSTVFLIDCRLPFGTWSIGDACHLVVLGGVAVGALRINAEPTASVTVEGLITRRAGNVWIITPIPYGPAVDVDGVTYHWESDNVSRHHNRTFRGKDVEYIHITNTDGTSITFELPDHDYSVPGWWHGYVLSIDISPEIITRAVRIVMRSGPRHLRMLTPDETLEAFDRAPRPLAEDLACVLATLPKLDDRDARRVFARCMVAAGCRDSGDARTQIDTWITAHADELRAARPGFQAMLDDIANGGGLWQTRSAIAFLVDACSRSGIDMPLDPAKAEQELLRFPHDKPWPWGIPPSHTWWSKKPPPEPEEPDDPRGR